MSPLGCSWIWFFLNEGEILLERKTEISTYMMSFKIVCFVLRHIKVIQTLESHLISANTYLLNPSDYRQLALLLQLQKSTVMSCSH